MGWFSDAVDWCVGKVAGAARAVGGALKKVAEFGGRVIDGVKNVYHDYVKPALQWAQETVMKPIKKFLGVAAVITKTVAMAVAHIPVINLIAAGIATATSVAKKAVDIADAGITVLLSLENSPILKAIDKAASVILPKMKRVGERLEKWADVVEGVNECNKVQRDLDALKPTNENESQRIKTLSLLNRLYRLKPEVDYKLNQTEFENMEQYLQAAFLNKICGKLIRRINDGETVADLTEDDLFIFEISEEILGPDPVLSEEDKERFHNAVEKALGKSFDAAVSEEMTIFWNAMIEEKEKKLEKLRDKKSKLDADIQMRESSAEMDILSEHQKKTLGTDKKRLDVMQRDYDSLRDEIEGQRYYVYAIEGLQLSLENKLGKVLPKEEAKYIESQIEGLAGVIKDAFDEQTMFLNLPEEQQDLVRDLANVFKDASEKRVKNKIDDIRLESRFIIDDESRFVEVEVA
jgi:hypothetical protein